MLTSEALGQEVDMGSLIAGDGLEVGVNLGVESGVLEVGLGVLGETITIEGILEMLQGQGILENVGCFMLDLASEFSTSCKVSYHQ